MKGVLEFIEGISEYSEEDLEKCREFLKMQKAPEKKYKWSDGGDSLPAGWRKRVGEGEARWEYVLSPEGRMYRSRFVAVQDMLKRNYGEEEVAEMRDKLVQEEGWKTDHLLPVDWLYKVNLYLPTPASTPTPTFNSTFTCTFI